MRIIINFLCKFYFSFFKFFLETGKYVKNKVAVKISQTLKGSLITVGGKAVKLPNVPGLFKFLRQRLPKAISAAGLIAICVDIFNFAKKTLGFDGDESDLIKGLEEKAIELGLNEEFGLILDAYRRGEDYDDSPHVSIDLEFSADINGDGILSHSEFLLVEKLGKTISKVDSNVLLMLQIIAENDFDMVSVLKFFRRYKNVSIH